MCYKIGNGLKINLRMDPWIESLPKLSLVLKECVDARQWSRVIDLRSEDGTSWNESILIYLCNEESVEAILRITWPSNLEEDKLFWLGNNVGVFFVGNCYDVNWNCGVAASTLWERIWKSKLHEHLKVFIWRILAYVIAIWEIWNGRYLMLSVWG